MGDNSKIEWTDATWNPIAGCSKVSPGCKHCYAMREAHRLSLNPNPKISERYEGLTHIVNGHPEWTGAARLNEDMLNLPLRWRRPRRIFVNSLSDLFQEPLPDEAIDRVFALMTLCPQHTFQILTKRELRLLSYLQMSTPELFHSINVAARSVLGHGPGYGAVLPTQRDGMVPMPRGWPPPNIRVGVSIEDRRRAHQRFPAVCELGEAGWNTMVSLEPLLGPVRIPERYLALGPRAWVIAGGESGPGARAPHPDWFRDLRDQCRAARVPFHFKQWGEYAPWREDFQDRRDSTKLIPCETVHSGVAMEAPTYMYHVGKKASGALLDGREWRQFPKEGQKPGK